MKPWFDPQVHWIERVKWLNTDKMREVIASNPMIEQIITLHLQQLQMMLMPPPAPVGPDGKPTQQPNGGGGGQAMSNSNQHSQSTGIVPHGQQQHPNAGPGNMGPK